MAVTLETPLSRVLGPKTATGMGEQLSLYTVRDLLRHYPRRFATRGERVDLADVKVGDRVTVVAKVLKVESRQMRTRKGRLTEVVVGPDGMLGDAVCAHLASRHPTVEVTRYDGGPSDLPLQVGVE